MSTTSSLISQSELSRRLNLPARTVSNAIRTGLIEPDTVALGGRLHLFELGRLAEIQSLLAQPEILATR